MSVEPETTRGWSRVKSLVKNQPREVAITLSARLIGTDRAWRIDDERIVSAASTIKVAILVALHREGDAGRLDLHQPWRIEPTAVVGGSGILASLLPGLSLPLVDLAYLMIAISDNTASNVLLDLIGLEQMRVTIGELGLTRTELNRRFLGRLPDPGQPDNVTSAADMATLLAAIATDQAASATSCARMRHLLGLQQNRQRLGRRLPAHVGFAGKSGSLPGLVHDTGILTTAAGPLVVAVLTTGFGDPYAADELIGQFGLALVDEVEHAES
jgi:beta-lactamase class A